MKLNDTFALNDSEDNTENKFEDNSPNVAWLKFIESNGNVFKKRCELHQKSYRFSEWLEWLKVLQSKKNWADCFRGIQYNWDEYRRTLWTIFLYRRITTECEKVIES